MEVPVWTDGYTVPIRNSCGKAWWVRCSILTKEKKNHRHLLIKETVLERIVCAYCNTWTVTVCTRLCAVPEIVVCSPWKVS